MKERRLRLESTSQPSSQLYDVHTHEVTYTSAGSNVMQRYYSEFWAEFERDWQARQGRTVEVKRVGQ